MVHFVAHFRLRLINFCSAHRCSRHLDVDIKWHRSDDQNFLNFVKLGSPQILPAVIMTDHDKAQMNTILAVYLDSMVLLCWWHVLRAIRMHFRTEVFPELWEHV